MTLLQATAFADLYYQDWQRGGAGGVGDDGVSYAPVHGRRQAERQFQDVMDSGEEVLAKKQESGDDFFAQDLCSYCLSHLPLVSSSQEFIKSWGGSGYDTGA